MKRETPHPDTLHPAPEPGGGGDARVAPRGTIQLLLDRGVGPFFLGKLLSSIGVWAHNIAAAIVVWSLTESALLVGAVSVGQFLPQLLITPLSGARADRGDRRRQLILGRLVATSGSFALVVWSLVVGLDGRAGAFAIIICSTLVGFGFAIGNPAMQALLPALVRPSELASAVALSSMPFTIARAIGPAVGALLVASAGNTAAFGLAGLTNLAFAAVLWRLPIRAPVRPKPRDTRIRAAWHYVRSDRKIFALLVCIFVVSFGVDPVTTLTPAIVDNLGVDRSFVGVLGSSFGVGAGVAFLVLGRCRAWLGLPVLANVGMATLAVSNLGLALVPSPTFALVVLALGGVGMTFSVTSLATLMQIQIPDEIRGRVMALWTVAFLGSRPLAAGSSGAIADLTSPTVALLLITAIIGVGLVLGRPPRITPRARADASTDATTAAAPPDAPAP